MKRPIFNGNIQNNDDFRRCIHRRIKVLWCLFAAGLFAVAISLWANFFMGSEVNERVTSYYTGAGTGLIAGALIFIVRSKLLLKNESALTKSRIENTDERLADISRRALMVTAYVMLGCVYAAGLIGGIFYPVMTVFLSVYVALFLITYFIAWKIYDRKM